MTEPKRGSATCVSIPDPWGGRLRVGAMTPRRRDWWRVLLGRYKARVWTLEWPAGTFKVYNEKED